MEMNQVIFLVWCLGIHCMLWALMDSATRNAIVFAYNKMRYIYMRKIF